MTHQRSVHCPERRSPGCAQTELPTGWCPPEKGSGTHAPCQPCEWGRPRRRPKPVRLPGSLAGRHSLDGKKFGETKKFFSARADALKSIWARALPHGHPAGPPAAPLSRSPPPTAGPDGGGGALATATGSMPVCCLAQAYNAPWPRVSGSHSSETRSFPVFQCPSPGPAANHNGADAPLAQPVNQQYDAMQTLVAPMFMR